MDSSISSVTFKASGSEEATYITNNRYTSITLQLNYRMSFSIFDIFPFFKMTFDFNLERLKHYLSNHCPTKPIHCKAIFVSSLTSPNYKSYYILFSYIYYTARVKVSTHFVGKDVKAV